MTAIVFFFCLKRFTILRTVRLCKKKTVILIVYTIYLIANNYEKYAKERSIVMHKIGRLVEVMKQFIKYGENTILIMKVVNTCDGSQTGSKRIKYNKIVINVLNLFLKQYYTFIFRRV